MEQPEGDMMMATATEEPTTEPTDAEPTDAEQQAVALAEQAAAAREASENHAALERAVADLPDVPGSKEFLTLCQLARVYSQSGIVPKALKGKPHDVLVVLMTGRDLGIPLTAALRKVYVIDGQPSIAPQLKLSLVRKKGLGRIIPHPDNDKLWDRQGAIPLGPGGEVITDAQGNITGWTEALGPPFWFTWAEDAVIGGYVRAGCTPTQHTPECDKARSNSGVPQFNGRTANFCKDNYRKSPKRMLWARASGFVADDYFSEASMGLYDVDELGGMLDDSGELIDVNHVEVPDGFGPAGRGGDQSGGGEADALVDLADAWELQVQVFALPEDAQAEFRQRWVQGRVAGSLADDPTHEPPRRRFAAAKLNLVRSMLRGVEQQWKAQGRYDPDTGPAALVENVVVPAVLRLLPLPFDWTTTAPPSDPTPNVPQEAVGASGMADAADTAPESQDAADGEPGGSGGEPGGVLPLDVAADEAAGLLSVPDAVRSASDDDKAEWAVAYVKAMSLTDVDVLLRHYQVGTKGTPNDRRGRLVFQVLEHELGIAGAVEAGG